MFQYIIQLQAVIVDLKVIEKTVMQEKLITKLVMLEIIDDIIIQILNMGKHIQ